MIDSSNIIGGNGTRNERDFYPTPAEVTKVLLDNIDWPKSVIILEPACGDGAMAKVLTSYFDEVKSSDIETGDDFLTVDLSSRKFKCDGIITNPPFSLAEAFIIKSLDNCSYVAMLTKSTFWHAKSRTKIFEKYPPAKILALNWRPQFGGEKHSKSSPTMDFIWTIWEPQDNNNTIFRVVGKGS